MKVVSAGVAVAQRHWRDEFFALVNGRPGGDEATEELAGLRAELEQVSMDGVPESSEALVQSMPTIAVTSAADPDNAALLFHAPLNLLEGAWLQSVAQARSGHLSSVAALFATYSALLGRNEADSPAAVFRGALSRAAINLPPVTASGFANDSRVGTAALAFAVLQLKLSRHSLSLVPELIGFNLGYVHSQSEWRLVACSQARREARLRDVAGHAAQALASHLADFAAEHQEREWQRVRRGYALYGQYENTCTLAAQQATFPLADRIAALIEHKAPYAKGYHGHVTLAGKPLEQWLAETPFDCAGFLRAFAASPYLSGPVGRRPFDRLAGFGGPMFGVFTADELQLLGDWATAAQAADSSPVVPMSSLDPDRAENTKPLNGVPIPVSASTTKTSSQQGRTVPRTDLDRRASFHRLLNSEVSNAATHGLAEYWVEQTLRLAARALTMTGPENNRYFAYAPAALTERVERIHRCEVSRYQALTGKPKLRREEYLWGIRQFAPTILVDGCWLQRMGEAADQDDPVHRRLFRIYADELGAGNVEHNHPNVYRRLLESCGIFLPEVDSEDFARHDGFLDAAFDVPVYLLAISRFPQRYLPELLGLNLAIELSGLGAQYMQLRDELEYWQIDPLIVSLHLSIDNLASGHTAWAVEAIQLFLDRVHGSGGDQAVDEYWRRIWTGYLSLQTAPRRFKRALMWDFARNFWPQRVWQRLSVSSTTDARFLPGQRKR